MNLTRVVYRQSLFFFAAFAVLAVPAFWPTYLSNIAGETDFQVHMHAVVMTVWLGVLITQAYLIRSNLRPLHRQIGRFTYFLAPVVFVSLIVITHNGLTQAPEVTDRVLIFHALVLGQIPLFAFAYCMAIYYRRDPATLGRFMLCTALPMVAPIVARILVFHVVQYVDFIPRFSDGSRFPLFLVLPAIDVLLVGFAIWDWKVHQRLNVFPLILAVWVIPQVLGYFLYDTEQWRIFIAWFSELPLS